MRVRVVQLAQHGLEQSDQVRLRLHRVQPRPIEDADLRPPRQLVVEIGVGLVDIFPERLEISGRLLRSELRRSRLQSEQEDGGRQMNQASHSLNSNI